MSFWYIMLLWSIAGLLFAPLLKSNETNEDVPQVLFVGGPVLWMLAVILYIRR